MEGKLYFELVRIPRSQSLLGQLYFTKNYHFLDKNVLLKDETYKKVQRIPNLKTFYNFLNYK